MAAATKAAAAPKKLDLNEKSIDCSCKFHCSIVGKIFGFNATAE